MCSSYTQQFRHTILSFQKTVAVNEQTSLLEKDSAKLRDKQMKFEVRRDFCISFEICTNVFCRLRAQETAAFQEEQFRIISADKGCKPFACLYKFLFCHTRNYVFWILDQVQRQLVEVKNLLQEMALKKEQLENERADFEVCLLRRKLP